MAITISIDETRAAMVADWLGRLFDAASSRSGERSATERADGEYSGARDALAALGVEVQFDPCTKRPTAIKARDSGENTR
jgi:hypothetical protein